MSKRKFKEIATNPSGHVGVYRASNAKGWKAYVMGKDESSCSGSITRSARRSQRE